MLSVELSDERAARRVLAVAWRSVVCVFRSVIWVSRALSCEGVMEVFGSFLGS